MQEHEFAARRQAIASIKLIFAAREGSATHHVLYNLLRGLDPRRGFTQPLRRGSDTNHAFQAAAAGIADLALRLGVSLNEHEQAALKDAVTASICDDYRATAGRLAHPDLVYARRKRMLSAAIPKLRSLAAAIGVDLQDNALRNLRTEITLTFIGELQDAGEGAGPVDEQAALRRAVTGTAAGAIIRLADDAGVAVDAQTRARLQNDIESAFAYLVNQAGAQVDVLHEGTPGDLNVLQRAMLRTQHGPRSNVYEHGADTAWRYHLLIAGLSKGKTAESWPQWLKDHGQDLLARQLPRENMLRYLTFHDCGKPFVMQRDTAGRLHFPEHSEASARIWLERGGVENEAELMRLDMALHTLGCADMASFATYPLAPSLLLTTWCELASNIESLFGGPDTDASKIKTKALDRRARALCTALFA